MQHTSISLEFILTKRGIQNDARKITTGIQIRQHSYKYLVVMPSCTNQMLRGKKHMCMCNDHKNQTSKCVFLIHCSFSSMLFSTISGCMVMPHYYPTKNDNQGHTERSTLKKMSTTQNLAFYKTLNTHTKKKITKRLVFSNIKCKQGCASLSYKI